MSAPVTVGGSSTGRVLFIRNSCTLMSHSQLGYGVGIVATIASAAGHQVRVIDNNTMYKFYRDRDFVREIRSFRPDVLAFCITLHNAFETYRQIPIYRRLFPGVIIIAGGIHMKHCAEEALRHGVDAVVDREGEKVIVPLLAHLLTAGPDNFRRGLEAVPGVSFVREDGTLHAATEHPALADLDEVPCVDYDLFNLRDYIKTGSEPGLFYVTGQRGCPFTCTFCSDEIQRADRRIASARWLFENVAALHRRYGVRYLLIADNNITLAKDRLAEFCRLMIDSGLNAQLTFSSQTTTRFALSDDLVALMREAGFRRMNFGVERLTPDSLHRIKKQQPFENVHNILALVARHNIDPSVFMMVGFPFETRELLQREKKLFLELTKYTRRLFLSVLAPTPGTCYYDDNPHLKEWYLNRQESLMLRSYFANVLDMHTFHTIRRNFFGLPREVQDEMVEYYQTFKRISHGSVFTRKDVVITLVMRADFLVAKISQALFALSPDLEFLLFRRLKAVRYYLGNYFFGEKMLKEDPGAEA